jgi:transketolase
MKEETVETVSVDTLCINTLRFLAVDAVQKANSGHPGLPMGAAPMAYTLWDRFMKFNPKDPKWPNRDRFVLSAGHGSALLYALLHMTGYDLPLEQIKNFRQWGSTTPGHPEHDVAPGVEATTGPLGQGLGNSVGMAIAEAALVARFNRPGFDIVDHHTYVLAGDGDLMEGISSEAASLAGHLKLGKLIVLYDNNHISIEGNTELAFTEDRVGRFAAFGWHTQSVEDGNDVEAVAAAIKAAQNETDRPSFISVRTHIGYGSPHKQDSASAHGEPLGEDEVKLTKANLGWPPEPAFYVPEEAQQHMGRAVAKGKEYHGEWKKLFQAYVDEYPELANEFQRVMGGELVDEWDADIPWFKAEDGPMATRAASGKVLNAIAKKAPELMGGSADLAPSNKTLIADSGSFSAEDPSARNLHFGVREHGMGAILNGMALHGGVVPYGATFLIFSDYMRPPIRLAAMSGLPVIYVFTHDSIAVGEDGPTHQPVEQIVGLRSVPGLTVIRPADANETAAAWKIAMSRCNDPTALICSRQKLPILDPGEYPQVADGLSRGAYVLAEAENAATPAVILVATGSEVHLALAAHKKLLEEKIQTRVVSFPSWDLFAGQPEKYRKGVFPENIPVLAIEAGVSLGWQTYIGNGIDVISVDKFGASAPGKVVMEKYGFTVENVVDHVRELMKKGGK